MSTATSENIFSRENWNSSGAGPLYIQLRDHLETIISSGHFKAGEPLPSEREIAEFSDVSRITVRKAVQELVRANLVVQKQGSGTSVAPKVERVEQSLSSLTSFSEDMARRGMEIKSTFLEKRISSPSPKEIMALGLRPSQLVARIWRLRHADGIPMAIERASLSTQFLPDPENVDVSLYAHLEKSGNKPSRAIQRISAANIGIEDAKLLAVPEGVAGLNIERISYSNSGQIVEFTSSIYRGDAYDFVAEMQISNEN
ncbi:GntR family transcriptional regulator [Lentilitoribacter sp. Alg239-R112]|uniref:GntR family transcriptional regulator n=1 Tax=Lentilitoribacter sp. EG35 TaxID=3234192 RepID=UPI0018D8990E